MTLFSVMGFGVLSDMSTGYPMLLSELTLATALRTAATSVMVARSTCSQGFKSNGCYW